VPKVSAVGGFGSADGRSFVIRATPLEGRVLPGMVLRIPFNSALVMTVTVADVQPDGQYALLTVERENEHELDLWNNLNIGSEVLEVSADGGEAG